jgi:lysophospholipase L1-like esterase
MRPGILRRVAFAALSGLLVFGLLEGGAWLLEWTVFFGQTSTSRQIPLPAPGAPGTSSTLLWEQLQRVQLIEDETTGWSLPPSSTKQESGVLVRINALGLRGPELVAKGPGEKRILTLGDSSIFGIGVEEKYVFSTVLAEDLEKSLSVPVTPFIGGVPGFASDQALARLKEVGAAVQPDWVVIGTLWSDVFRNDQLNKIRYRKRITGPFEHFALYRVLRLLLAPYLTSQKVGWIDGAQDVGRLDDEGLPPRTGLADYMINLKAMAEQTVAVGGKPVFLVLPAPMDFDKVPPPETVTAYRGAMKAVAEAMGAPVVDGVAVFKEKGSMRYFLDQVHPSREGHALLGHAIATTLQK